MEILKSNKGVFGKWSWELGFRVYEEENLKELEIRLFWYLVEIRFSHS